MVTDGNVPVLCSLATLVTVDKSGRMVLPKKVRERLGVEGEGILLMEVKESEVVLKRTQIERSPSKAISKMNLPTGHWSKVEQEIEEGATLDESDDS
jgi:AbrB family looped-hinge helix DNA binding protein